MSTTRWIIWCEKHGSANPYRLSSVCESFLRGIHMGDEAPQELTTDCQLVERLVVDPDNLPPVAIQRAAEYIRETFPCSCLAAYSERGLIDPHCPTHDYEDEVSNLITAFLSDPEETT